MERITSPRRSPCSRGYCVSFVLIFGVLLALLSGGCGPTSNAQEEQQPTTWTIEGPLQAWEGTIWIVDATPIVVPSELGLDERRWLGAVVTASGSFDDAGQRVAEQASLVEGELPNSTLPAATVSGVIDAIDADEWTIGGQAVLVPPDTHLITDAGPEGTDGLAQPGNQAIIEGYTLADGRVLAVQVTLRPSAGNVAPATTTTTSTNVAPTSTPLPANTADDGATDTSSDDASNTENDNAVDADDDSSDDKPDTEDNKGKPGKPDKPDKPDHDNGKHKGNDDDEGSVMTRVGTQMPAVAA